MLKTLLTLFVGYIVGVFMIIGLLVYLAESGEDNDE